jgi:hypothetical protein
MIERKRISIRYAQKMGGEGRGGEGVGRVSDWRIINRGKVHYNKISLIRTLDPVMSSSPGIRQVGEERRNNQPYKRPI